MRYGRLKKSDLGAVATITGAAFSFPATEAETWLSNAGMDQLRVVREGGRVVGSLLLIPMGQYFGGKSVPIVGIAGVGVGIADRGRGVARALMAGTVRELAESGVALSTLYASTQTLYRSVGYERAGKLMLVRAATSVFSAPRTKLIARTLEESDEPATAALYDEVAPSFHGYLQRGPYMWKRIRAPRGKSAFGVGFFAPSSRGAGKAALEAYVYFVQAPATTGHLPYHVVSIKDAVSRTSEGYDAIVRLIGEQRSIGRDTELRAGPSSPILMKLAEAHYEEKTLEDWMVRVTHVENALAQRGYPLKLDAELHLEIQDDLVPENNGRFVLSLRDGKPHVKKGGKRSVQKYSLALDVRGLAPLYTGYLSATELARLGLVRGAGSALALADAVFASPMPSMCEMF